MTGTVHLSEANACSTDIVARFPLNNTLSTPSRIDYGIIIL